MPSFRLPIFRGPRRQKFSAFNDLEPQEILLDRLAKRKEEELGVSEKKFEVPLSDNLIRFFLFLFIVLVFGIFAKTFELQIFKKNEYQAMAQENRFMFHFVESSRGVIYDSKGVVLATNRPSFNLVVNKEYFPEDKNEQERILSEIADVSGVFLSDLKDKMAEDIENPILISEIIDHQRLIVLEAKISGWPGIEIEKSSVREYIDALSFAHIMGYTGMVSEEEMKENPEFYSGLDQVGRAGIEKTYEDILRRNSGKIRIERDAKGRQISKEVIALPESGNSLVLWTDAGLQKKIEEELKKTMESVSADNGVGIAINPKTGGVLALVSLPTYDNNIFSQKSDANAIKTTLNDKSQPMLNRAIAGKYVTGSSIKPFIASAALEEKTISPDKIIDDRGYITITNKYDPSVIYKFSGITPHGLVDMRKALAVSSNIYFYTVGGGYDGQQGLGPSRIKKYLDLFGWEEKTGIDIPNESAGFVPSPEWKKSKKGEGWWDGDTYNISIGQGDIGVTPLEVINAYAAVANGGTLYKPQIVKEIVNSEKDSKEGKQPEVIRQNFINPENLKIIREGMRLAVTAEDTPHASCKILNSLPVATACKTGTAQTSYTDHYHNWITVFAPYDDPEIVILLMVENVDQRMAVVIPTMNEILKWYFSQK